LIESDVRYKLINLHESLERFAYSLTTNKDNAKDLVQETYLKALTYIDSFKEDTNLKAWAFTIMKNTFINIYRKVNKINNSIDSSEDQFMLNIRFENNSPDSQYSHNEINKKIDELDDNFRIPFQMHMSGYKYKEIARNLNLKIGTVKSRIFLSRKKLIDKLNK
jgi:RNA polymerase sigma factor (sigma-70 family)